MRVYMVYVGDFTWPLFCYYFPSFPAKSVGVLWKTVAHLAVKAPVRISQKPRKKLDANQKTLITIDHSKTETFFCFKISLF